jgi:hypothetical protein
MRARWCSPASGHAHLAAVRRSWVGDNGGATWQGVTKGSITIVYVRVPVPQVVEPRFRAGGLAATQEEEELSLQTYGRFFEKRYEYYGRKVRWVLEILQCDPSNPDYAGCQRQEIRRINQKHHPFAIFQFGGGGPPSFYEEAARLGIVAIGGQTNTAAFNAAYRPYHYDVFPDSDQVALHVADYWCKKMYAKPATLAGDPLLRSRSRKLGILAEQALGGSGYEAMARSLIAHVTGGRCGRAGDEPITLIYSGDISQASDQMTAAATTFRDNNVTTVVCLCIPLTPIFMTQSFDEQHYFPEHLISGTGAVDVDVFGRLYTQTQWRNAFGPSFFTDTIQNDGDPDRAWRDAGQQGNNNPCVVCAAIYLYMEPLAVMLQWAGPNLTPAALERGTLNAPPIGGWERSKHDPTVPLWAFGSNDYTAWSDSRQVYWDPAATSGADGKQGAYRQLEGGKRYEIGQWIAGEPRA